MSVPESQGAYAKQYGYGRDHCNYKPFSDEWFDWQRAWGKA